MNIPENLRQLLPLLLPLVILQLALLAAALWDLAHRERVRGGNKLVWVLVIVLVNFIGPLVYFLFGREE
ncbi:MAG: PLDc N-terminal domain-containing protein [Anaerolineae bacterium]|nr:PLDc N-terminal domain-containing protein [Anaerolineae bacterium]